MMVLKAMYMVVIDILAAPIAMCVVIALAIKNKQQMGALLEGIKMTIKQQLAWVQGGKN